MNVTHWLDANLISMVDGVAYGLLFFTLAVGLSLVFGMMDVLNLAHGTLYLAGAYLAFRLADGGWWGLVFAIGAGLLVGVLGGAALTAMTRPLGHRGHLDQALLTLGVSLVGAEVFSIATAGQYVPVFAPPALSGSAELAGHPYPVYRLLFIGVAGVLAVLVYFVFERSSLGALVRATVADREMVRALGIDTRRVLLGVFIAGSVLAVVGGVLGAPILQPGPRVDEQVLLMSLIVVVIGGLGSVRGALLGALVVGQVETLGRALWPQFAGWLLFAVMFVVLAARPRGLVSVVRPA